MHVITSELERVRPIPVGPAIRVERPSKYGSVPGLDDDELADLDELERLVAWQVWGPLLALRPQRCMAHMPYASNGSGVIDWEAVGAVTFRRPVSGSRDVSLSTRRIRELLGREGVLRVCVTRPDSPGLPERPEEYPEYDELVKYGLVPRAKLDRRRGTVLRSSE